MGKAVKARITKANSIKQIKMKKCKPEGSRREMYCTNPMLLRQRVQNMKLLTTKACNKLREPKGKRCTNPEFVRQSTQNKKSLNKAKLNAGVQQTLWEPRGKNCTNPVFVRQSTQNNFFYNINLVTTLLMTILTFTWRDIKTTYKRENKTKITE